MEAPAQSIPDEFKLRVSRYLTRDIGSEVRRVQDQLKDTFDPDQRRVLDRELQGFKKDQAEACSRFLTPPSPKLNPEHQREAIGKLDCVPRKHEFCVFVLNLFHRCHNSNLVPRLQRSHLPP